MALPNNIVSSTTVSDALLPPDDVVTTTLEDFERAGVAINDVSGGLNAANWRCYVDPSNAADVYIQVENGAPVFIFSSPGIEAVTFAFDQLMRPHVVYRTGQVTSLRWFDPIVNNFITTPFGNLIDPKLSFDDKRITQSGSRGDIIFAYLRESGGTRGLYYRQQRDRFQAEYALRVGLPNNTRLRSVGMNRGLRMQFNLQ